MSVYVPVVVLGAGPTGTTAANLLGQYGVRCLVVDRRPDVYPLPRAVHLDDEVFRIFADMGLRDEIDAITRPAPGMQLTDHDHRVLAQITRDPDRQVHGYPQANMFDQPELERVLRTALDRFPHVELRTGIEVVHIVQVNGGAAPVCVRLRVSARGGAEPAPSEESEVWTELVLACDGANSMARGVIGAGMERLCFEQRWLVVDADSAEPLPGYDGVQQVCHYERAATFMPVVPGRYRWEFRMGDGDDPQDFDDACVRQLIKPWLGNIDPEKVTIVRRAGYTFRGAVADRWRDGQIFLLGDAAHLTPPFIGQGLCAGVRDAANLAWKAALVVNGYAADRILDTYAAERRPYARRVVQMAVLVGWLMTGGTRRTAPVRRIVMRAVTTLPGIEDRALDVTWPRFSPGPIVRRRNRHSLAGRLIPQPRVRTSTGGIRRLDNVLGHGFAIIYRGPDVTGTYDAELMNWFTRLGVTVLRLGADIDDLDGVIGALFDRAGTNAMLLRPDRIVAADADRPALREWQRLLREAGIEPSARPSANHQFRPSRKKVTVS